jgi:hypothetical protein
VGGFFRLAKPSPRKRASEFPGASKTAIDMMGGMTDRQTKITFGKCAKWACAAC